MPASRTGVFLGLLTVVKVLDIGISAAFARPFDPLGDPVYAGAGVSFLRDALGTPNAYTVAVLAALLVVAVLALLWNLLGCLAIAGIGVLFGALAFFLIMIGMIGELVYKTGDTREDRMSMLTAQRLTCFGAVAVGTRTEDESASLAADAAATDEAGKRT